MQIVATNLQQNQSVSDASIYRFKGNVGICIHKYTGCGDNLYLDCQTLGMEMIDLNTDDIYKAVRIAQDKIYKRIQNLSKLYIDIATDESEVELVRW